MICFEHRRVRSAVGLIVGDRSAPTTAVHAPSGARTQRAQPAGDEALLVREGQVRGSQGYFSVKIFHQDLDLTLHFDEARHVECLTAFDTGGRARPADTNWLPGSEI